VCAQLYNDALGLLAATLATAYLHYTTDYMQHLLLPLLALHMPRFTGTAEDCCSLHYYTCAYSRVFAYQSTHTPDRTAGDVHAAAKGGGDSPVQVQQRAVEVIDAVLQLQHKFNLLLTHGRTIRVLLLGLSGGSLADMEALSSIPNTGLYVFAYSKAGKFRLLRPRVVASSSNDSGIGSFVNGDSAGKSDVTDTDAQTAAAVAEL
jgi:Histidine phosphatase superfamily (branch 1)